MRVYIADGSALFSRRLKQMLSGIAGVEIIGSSSDPATALDEIGKLRPDVLMLDVHLFRGGALEILAKVKQEGWAFRVLMLTDDISRQYQDRCRKAGADFLLYKPDAQEKAKEILTGLIDHIDSARK